MTTNRPFISVVMPVKNGAAFVEQAIITVLEQSYRHIELIIVDDHSTDATPEILNRMSQMDSRIKILTRESSNLVEALNSGIATCAGKYVARMDADDLAAKRRLEYQVDFLERHLNVDVVGTFVRIQGENSTHVLALPVSSQAIRCHLLFYCPLAHPSVMCRRAFFEKGFLYDPEFLFAEDFHLWARAAQSCQLMNLPKPLLMLRKHQGQITSTHAIKARRLVKLICRSQIEKLGIIPDENELELHTRIHNMGFQFDPSLLGKLETWLERLFEANERTQYYNKKELRCLMSAYWTKACSMAFTTDLQCWNIFRSSKLAKWHPWSGDYFRLLRKAALKMMKQ